MNNFIITFTIILSILNISAQKKFIQGIDISSLLVVEKNNGQYFDNGQPVDAINLFKENGANYVRLRLWHSPADSNYNLEYNLNLAERVKSAGMNLLLDIFYSDTWTDPGQQNKPAAWENLSFSELKDSVYQYSANVVSTFKENDLLPQLIQIGNEINCGMLWPEGNICTNDSNWNNFAQLLQSAYNGIQSALAPADSVRILIHSASGGNNEQTKWFYDNLLDQDVNFDIIGLSYYPWWHGTLEDLQNNLNDVASSYSKEIIVVETAYPWTLDWNDNTHNSVGMESQLLDGYPATPQGQKQFLLDEINIIKNTPNNLGVGWFYWEPAFITSDAGSPWENLAMFDFDGNTLPTVEVFNDNVSSIEEDIEKGFHLYQNYPNPFNPTTTIKFSIPSVRVQDAESLHAKLIVYDILGRNVATLVNETISPGSYKVKFDASEYASGLYFYKLTYGNYSETKKLILMK